MNKIVDEAMSFTKGELRLKEYDQRVRELRIKSVRAEVVKKQLVEVYEKLENIRLDYLSDTAFRDMITGAKREIESALNDYLLDTGYWKKRLLDFPKDFADSCQPNNQLKEINDKG